MDRSTADIENKFEHTKYEIIIWQNENTHKNISYNTCKIKRALLISDVNALSERHRCQRQQRKEVNKKQILLKIRGLVFKRKIKYTQAA